MCIELLAWFNGFVCQKGCYKQLQANLTEPERKDKTQSAVCVPETCCDILLYKGNQAAWDQILSFLNVPFRHSGD